MAKTLVVSIAPASEASSKTYSAHHNENLPTNNHNSCSSHNTSLEYSNDHDHRRVTAKGTLQTTYNWFYLTPPLKSHPLC